MTKFSRTFVWTGGALFVASLACCAWWYLVSLGRALPFAGWAPLVYDCVIFTVFALHHSVFARASVKRWFEFIPAHLLRSVYVWIASALLILVCLWWRSVGGQVYDATGVLAVAAAIVQLSGIGLIARAVARIDPLELAGIHPSSRSEALQIEGPYRWVRHPLYLGWILAVFGAAHMTGDRLTFAALTSIYLVVAVPLEERSLRQSFGDDYARYQRTVRWRVIPYLY
ncbi:MAG: isoprenylcysteine carboxylmethyltransferase family protein [Acidobacteria bacterium]|nr:isoprenylcysteine carboxylmethyltransferase family protein [Acidobacteriota bacterium]